MCGDQPDGCSPVKLVDYLGNNPQSPFVFIMNVSDASYIAEDVENNLVHIKPVNTSQHECSNPINMEFWKAPACGCSVIFLL